MGDGAEVVMAIVCRRASPRLPLDPRTVLIGPAYGGGYSLELDSLQFLDLLLEVEDSLQVPIVDLVADDEHARTLGRLLELVEGACRRRRGGV